MIIQFDGFFCGEVLLVGQTCSRQQLKKMYEHALLVATNEEELPEVFGRLYQFEKLADDSTIRPHYVIDTDIDKIYAPSY